MPFDSRALFGEPSRPIRPHEPGSVALALAKPGLSLRLRRHKRVQAYEAWLWEGSDGLAYFSKKMASGKTLAWGTNATIERVLKRNRRSMPAQATEEENGPSR